MTSAVSNCLNCKAELSGEYCSECGQSIHGPRRLFWTVMHEALENIFQLDSRAIRTLWQTAFLPGRVTRQYLDGKRMSFVNPVRFYIVTSIVFFVILSLQNLMQKVQVQNDQQGNSVTVQLDLGDDELDETEVNFNLPLLKEETNLRIKTFLEEQIKKVRTQIAEDPSEVAEQLIDLAPPLVFLVLPFVALVLTLLMMGRGYYFTEHLIYTVYSHCFLFLMFSTQTLLIMAEIPIFSIGMDSFINIWMPIYLVWSLKHVYQLSWPGLMWRLPILALFYFILVMISAGILFLVGLVTF